MKRLSLILTVAVLAVSCSVSRNLRSVPFEETPDMGAAVFDSIDANWRPLAKTIAQEGKLIPVSGNTAQIFTEGHSKFAVFNEDLEKAEKYIDMEYYRFDADSIAHIVKDILVDKANEGVPVRIIMETRSNPPKIAFYKPLKKVASVIAAQPLKDVWGSLWNLNYRDHRKIVVIDGKYCYTGGMNISDDYWINWRDTHIRLEGPIVRDFEHMYDYFWQYFSGQPADERPVDSPASEGGAIMQLAHGGKFTKTRPIKEGFEQALAAAKQYFYIQTPYLCPPKSTIKAMKEAVERGVDVRLMLPKTQDVPVMLWVNHYFYKEMLEAGVRIFEREEPFMHSKTFVADDYMSCYGSANIDNRSYFINYESNVYIYDDEIGVQSRQIFEEDLTHSEEVKLENLHWPLWERFMQKFVIIVGYPQW